jgi:hypothetical protein
MRVISRAAESDQLKQVVQSKARACPGDVMAALVLNICGATHPKKRNPLGH